MLPQLIIATAVTIIIGTTKRVILSYRTFVNHILLM